RHGSCGALSRRVAGRKGRARRAHARAGGKSSMKLRGGKHMIRVRHLALASALALAFAAGATPTLAQRAARPAAAAVEKWPGLPPGAVEETMTLRDGNKLAANVYKPTGMGPWPVVLSRTPYL